MAFSVAQSFDSKITNATLQIGEGALPGFKTQFDFPPQNVEKGWWKYAKKFALPKNMRSHYEVTIPATNDSRSVVIYTTKEKSGNGTLFSLGLKQEGMSEEEKTKFSGQARALLLDFKRWYYLREYEEQLDRLEKGISRKGKKWEEWIRFVEKRKEILKKMKGI